MNKEKVKTSEFLIQSLATSVICFMACQTGFIYAWPSYTVELFKSNETVLATPMSSLEISLLGSLPNIGGLAASPFCGYAFNSLGRKYATILFVLPYVIAWGIISLTTNVVLVLVAYTIAGIGIAGQNVSIIYVSEIAHDAIRGGLTASSAVGFFLGILISYLFGGNLTYIQVVYIHLTLSVLCILLLLPLPESPVFLVYAGKEKEAAKAIAFYRRVKVSSKEVEAEISKIKMQLDPRLATILEAENDTSVAENLVDKKPTEEESKTETSWQFFKKSKSSQRALVSALIVMGSTILMGCVVLQVYAEPLFKDAVPSMKASQCAILLAIDFLVASVLCVVVIDRCGRKTLLTVTSAGSGVCALLLGSQLQFYWAPHWFTALLIYLYSFIYTMGCAVIPFVLAAEIFLPEVRSLCSSSVMASVWIFNFITLVIFNPLVEAMGLGPVFYFFSIVCFLGAGYSQFCLPETRGLSADAIQGLFLRKKVENSA